MKQMILCALLAVAAGPVLAFPSGSFSGSAIVTNPAGQQITIQTVQTTGPTSTTQTDTFPDGHTTSYTWTYTAIGTNRYTAAATSTDGDFIGAMVCSSATKCLLTYTHLPTGIVGATDIEILADGTKKTVGFNALNGQPKYSWNYTLAPVAK
jgi:hypothetical protein